MRALQDEPTAAHEGAARAIGDGPAAPTAQADAGAGLQLASYCACPADVQEQCRRDKLKYLIPVIIGLASWPSCAHGRKAREG